jgi:hypothetical protein
MARQQTLREIVLEELTELLNYEGKNLEIVELSEVERDEVRPAKGQHKPTKQ